jgi:hypothetical protein
VAQPMLIAVITAGASVVVALISVMVSARTLKLEREKAEVNKRHLDAQIAKLALETQKLSHEMSGVAGAQKAFEDARIDLEKKKLAAVSDTRTAIYPQLAELVYRIRNQIREINLATLALKGQRSVGNFDDLLRAVITATRGGGPDMYIRGVSQLTDDLYKYRLFIDPETWDKLHRFKRLAQNLVALIDRALRDPESEPRHPRYLGFRHILYERIEALADPVERTYSEIEELHAEINTGIKKYFGSVLERIEVDESTIQKTLPQVAPEFEMLFTPISMQPRLPSGDSEPPRFLTRKYDDEDEERDEGERFWPAIE